MCFVNIFLVRPAQDAGLSVSEIFLQKSVTSITVEAPPTWEQDDEENPIGIVWIIFLTVIIFAFGVCVIAALQRKCNQAADPFTYRAPRTISSLLCPCFEDTSGGRGMSMRGGGRGYMREYSEDNVELRPSNSSNTGGVGGRNVY